MVTNVSGNGLKDFGYQSYLSFNSTGRVDKNVVVQGFSFSTFVQNSSITSSFGEEEALLSVSIPADSVKWTIRINATAPINNSLLITYLLTDLSLLLSDGYSGGTTLPLNISSGIINLLKIPEKNTTIYYLLLSIYAPSSSSSDGPSSPLMAILEVLNAALVDGKFQTIGHYVLPPMANSNKYYSLVVQVPPFNKSFEFDPTLSIGTLLGGASSSSSSRNGGFSMYIIIGVTVGVVVAAAFIVVVAAIGLIITRRRKKAARARVLSALRQVM